MVCNKLIISISIEELAKELVALEKGEKYVEFFWEEYMTKASNLMDRLQQYNKDDI